MMPGRAAGLAVLLACTACGSASPTRPSPPVTTSETYVLLVAPSWELPIGGGRVDITIVTAPSPSGGVVPNVPVALEATAGELSTRTVRTDGSGRATVTWSGTETATITARAGDAIAAHGITVATPAPRPPLSLQLVALPRSASTITPVQFTAFVTAVDGTPLPAALHYAWDFDADGRVDSTATAPAFTFDRPGEYVSQLHVSTDDGREASASTTVFVTPGPLASVELVLTPSAFLVQFGEPIRLTVRANVTPAAGTIVRYEWDFDDDDPSVDRVTTDPQTSTSYDRERVFRIRVTAITDRDVRGTAVTHVTVQAPPSDAR